MNPLPQPKKLWQNFLTTTSRAEFFSHVLAFQETTSWVCGTVVPGCICFGSLTGLLCFLSTSISDVQKSREGYEQCTAVLVSKAPGYELYNAPTSDYDAVSEMVVGQVRSVLREARGMDAESFFSLRVKQLRVGCGQGQGRPGELWENFCARIL